MAQMRRLGALGIGSTSSSRGMSPVNERFDQEPPWHQNLILAKPSHAFFTKGWFQMHPWNILWSEEDWAVTCWVISMESGIDFLQSQGTWLLIPVVLHCSWSSTSPPFIVSSLSLSRTLQILPSPSSAPEGCECWGIIMSLLYNVRVQPMRSSQSSQGHFATGHQWRVTWGTGTWVSLAAYARKDLMTEGKMLNQRPLECSRHRLCLPIWKVNSKEELWNVKDTFPCKIQNY